MRRIILLLIFISLGCDKSIHQKENICQTVTQTTCSGEEEEFRCWHSTHRLEIQHLPPCVVVICRCRGTEP
jgi:hypothetical protein